MAKKRAARKKGKAQPSPSGASTKDTAASATVERARTTLCQAQEAYDQACDRAAEQAAKARNVTVGDVLDGTLEFVRRHPAAGVLAAGVIGFLLGRTKTR